MIQIFKGCLPQMLIGPFLKTSQMLPDSSERWNKKNQGDQGDQVLAVKTKKFYPGNNFVIVKTTLKLIGNNG